MPSPDNFCKPSLKQISLNCCELHFGDFPTGLWKDSNPWDPTQSSVNCQGHHDVPKYGHWGGRGGHGHVDLQRTGNATIFTIFSFTKKVLSTVDDYRNQAVKYWGGQSGKKIIDLPGGLINDPLSGKDFSLPFLLANPSSPSRTLEGLYELTWRPSWAINSPRTLLSEVQRNKDTVRSVALGM